MIDLTENTYCLGIWYCQRSGSDWLAAVTREGDGEMTLKYRFRYFVDDKAFDSEDVKHWYAATVPKASSEDEIVKVVDGIMRSLEAQGYERPWRAVIRGGAKEALDALQSAPFVHLRTSHLNGSN